MATKPASALFEIIAVSDVVKSPRGRTAELNSDLTEAFSQITTDEQALRLTGFGPFVTKEERASFSTIIRKNWAAVNATHKVKINYTTTGLAQIQRGKVNPTT